MINETPQAEAEQVRAGIRESHARLHRTAAQADDATMRRPSRLPSWTVGHVLTHLARNADSVVRRLEALSAQNWSSSIRMAEPPRSNKELHGKPPRSWTTCAPPTTPSTS